MATIDDNCAKLRSLLEDIDNALLPEARTEFRRRLEALPASAGFGFAYFAILARACWRGTRNNTGAVLVGRVIAIAEIFGSTGEPIGNQPTKGE